MSLDYEPASEPLHIVPSPAASFQVACSLHAELLDLCSVNVHLLSFEKQLESSFNIEVECQQFDVKFQLSS